MACVARAFHTSASHIPQKRILSPVFSVGGGKGFLRVFVSRPGNHIVALFDMQGRMIKEYRGSTPTDYNFSDLVQQGRSGVYLMRVAAGSAVKSKRFFVQ